MLEHRYVHRVRYRECDPMGVVYHAHYVDHFEAARTEALRSHGLPYRALEEAGVIMPVVELSVHYHRPARYDDLIEVHVAFPEPPTSRVTAQYVIRRLEPSPDEAPLVTGTVVLCFVDGERRRPVRAPASLQEVFARAGS
jgi:acyl-CoA thioester hydrolase